VWIIQASPAAASSPIIHSGVVSVTSRRCIRPSCHEFRVVVQSRVPGSHEGVARPPRLAPVGRTAETRPRRCTRRHVVGKRRLSRLAVVRS
jgi:hypothetical protein